MKTFSIMILTPRERLKIDNVVCFTGHDESGSFNILANASRRMTILSFGLASFRDVKDQNEFLAIYEGVLYFKENELKIIAPFFYRSKVYDEIHQKVDEYFKLRESAIKEKKRNLNKLDQEILKQITKEKFGLES
ncbi:hypothetical protein ACRXCV_10260 [Halobacteriovorax sp. GFR7]|uniref:hypothetical protein n=1 Tax=unclassified Halobacteriovorax TaxID=2639665 RepID=UPI003D9670B9